MHDWPPTSLPEDMVLINTDPASGVVKRRQLSTRVLAGAVLLELLLHGAITVDTKQIAGVRPLALGDPFAESILAEISDARPSRSSLRLTRWVDKASRKVDRAYLDRLTARGLLYARRRRVLGVFPSTRWTTVDLGWPMHLAARVDHAVRPEAYGPPGAYDLYLTALVDVYGLSRRLYPGRDNRHLRRRISDLSRTNLIVNAVRQVLAADARRRSDD
ncbi:GOLPH3/VPS74 family protein [Streptomyces soliscabiei]|uniref:GOLPH3/VPS74 family protein n=1 Tax=Streptomyces soliscabiei TaxID=588897 RepID=UPI0029AC82A8|nr:GPP34 family phosphoprotein [Streptomyces sp. NY05-11A]MDX2678923.1 GPP34 family phosphoprotein [Streptomyces sp. NY05-11A]